MRNAGLSKETILQNCVGDTIDSPKRDLFPHDRADLGSRHDGNTMFKIASEALGKIAQYEPSYSRMFTQPDKFCHGYGIFQYDLQFFLQNKNFFLNKSRYNFENV